MLAAAAFIACGIREKTPLGVRTYCVGAALLMSAYLIGRDLFSPVEYLARQDFMIVTGSLTLYLLVTLHLARSKPRLWLLAAMLVLAGVQITIAAVQFKRADSFMLLPWIFRTDTTWRASGFYISPNHFAGVLESLALLSLSCVVWSDLGIRTKVLIGYVGLACLLGLATSGSRGGYLSFPFGLMAFAILSLTAYRARGNGKLLPVLLIAVGLLGVMCTACAYLIAQSGVLTARIAATYEPENMRWFLWQAALAQFHLEPLWGTGSGTYLYYGRMFRAPAVQHDPINVHNDYLHLLAEYGIAGAAVFSLFLVTHLVAGVRNVFALANDTASQWSARANQLALQIGALSVIAAYAAHSILDFNLHIPANALLIAWMFGMIANPVIAVKNSAILGPRGMAAARGLMACVAAVVLAYGAPKLPGEWFAERAREALRDYRLEEARMMAGKALKYEKKNPDIYYYAGEAAREMSAHGIGESPKLAQEAVQMFSGALALFPQDVRCLLKLAQTYDSLRQFGLAEMQLQRAVEFDPTNSYVNAYYGMHYQSEGLLQEARAQYEAAVQLDSDNQMAKAGMANVEKLLGPAQTAAPAKSANEKLLDDALRDLDTTDKAVPVQFP